MMHKNQHSKFAPYNQMNEVYEDEEFQQEDSDPLVQQVDPDYEPTDGEIREYAQEVLGMNLPQDERLLYLAKEGLKAPIPQNWQPFQGRDGEVYYKHKITQEKTFEHPTDIEYRKKYVQEKERSARKNLKSMNLKNNSLVGGLGLGNNSSMLGGGLNQNNSLSGLGQPLSSSPMIGLSSKMHPLGLSNLSSESHSKEVVKLDPRIEKELAEEVENLQKKLRKQLKQFQEEKEAQHEKNLKKMKQNFENSISEVGNEKSSEEIRQAIKEAKQAIKSRLEDAYNDRFSEQVREIEGLQGKKNQEYTEIHEEDFKIKLKKYESEQESTYIGRTQRLEKEESSHAEYKLNKAKERSKIIADLKGKLQSEGSSEIQQATQEALNQEIQKIRSENQEKLKELRKKQESEYQQTKKILGHDPTQVIQEAALKKARLQKISEQKIESLKKKEFQIVGKRSEEQLEESLKNLQQKLERQNNLQLEKFKSEERKRLENLKKSYLESVKQENKRMIEELYENCRKDSSDYESELNRKLTQTRERYIQKIFDENNGKEEAINTRLSVKEKEDMIQNKEELVSSLARQVDLERLVLKQLMLSKELSEAKDIDLVLKRQMNELGLKYRPQPFIKHQKLCAQFKAKYKADKQLLGSLMTQLQGSRSLMAPRFDGTDSNSLLVKQYNKDVRTMRKNEETLSKYEILLRKAELGDEESLQILQTEPLIYEGISVRKNMAKDFDLGLNEITAENIEEAESHFKKNMKPGYTHSDLNIEDTLKQHSKFLSTVKNQLNRKLYKVRSNNLYRI